MLLGAKILADLVCLLCLKVYSSFLFYKNTFKNYKKQVKIVFLCAVR